MRRISAMIGLASVALSSALASVHAAHSNRIHGFENIRRHLRTHSLKNVSHHRKARNSIATGNRHGGPHLHLREIARRQHQNARKAASA